MNPRRITEMLNELRMLPMFPNDEYAFAGLVRLVGSMAESETQVRWLVNRMTSGIYAQWPGPQEMRACFCSKFKPRDGINAYSAVYVDGMPTERPALPSPATLKLPQGMEVSADLEMDRAVRSLAEAKRLRGPEKRA